MEYLAFEDYVDVQEKRANDFTTLCNENSFLTKENRNLKVYGIISILNTVQVHVKHVINCLHSMLQNDVSKLQQRNSLIEHENLTLHAKVLRLREGIR